MRGTRDAHPDDRPPRLRLRDRTSMKVLVSLHGIRTQAEWQRSLSKLVREKNWEFPFEDWYFGYFSVIGFLLPWARERKIRWFRSKYEALMSDRSLGLGDRNLPSIIAHSF